MTLARQLKEALIGANSVLAAAQQDAVHDGPARRIRKSRSRWAMPIDAVAGGRQQ
jgi:hypothetical protein